MKRDKYISRQRTFDFIEFSLRTLVFQIVVIPLCVIILIFILFSTFQFGDIIKNLDDPKGNADVYLKFTQYTIGIAGLFISVMTIIFFVFTNYQSNRKTTKQLFETRFFDLTKIHIDNTNQLEYRGNKSRTVFQVMHEEIVFISGHLNAKFPSIEINDRVVIAYLIIYFGLKGSLEDLKRYLFKYYSHLGATIDEMTNDLSGLHKNINSYDSPSPYKGRFEGFQSTLSHYFSHLHETVKFVDEKKFLSFDEKCSYIKIFRAQLSNFELSILLINSLGPLGKYWEMSKNEDTPGLITKYQIIKNMPTSLAMGIRINNVFPDIDFDGNE